MTLTCATLDLDQLIADHRGLARFAACRCWLPGGPDVDDLEQIAILRMIRLAPRWQPERGKFSTFVYPWVFQAVRRAIDRELRRPARRSIDRPMGDDGCSLVDGLRTRPEQAGDLDEGFGPMLDELNPTDRMMLEERFIDGLTLPEIADRHGITRQRVHQRIQRAIDRLRKSLEIRRVTTGCQLHLLRVSNGRSGMIGPAGGRPRSCSTSRPARPPSGRSTSCPRSKE